MDSPEEVVKVGDEIEVKILRVDRGERKIGLSRKKAQWTPKADGEEDPEGGGGGDESKPEGSRDLKGGLGGGVPLFSLGGAGAPGSEDEAEAEAEAEAEEETEAEADVEPEAEAKVEVKAEGDE